VPPSLAKFGCVVKGFSQVIILLGTHVFEVFRRRENAHVFFFRNKGHSIHQALVKNYFQQKDLFLFLRF
jgi:hypothetical protein